MKANGFRAGLPAAAAWRLDTFFQTNQPSTLSLVCFSSTLMQADANDNMQDVTVISQYNSNSVLLEMEQVLRGENGSAFQTCNNGCCARAQ